MPDSLLTQLSKTVALISNTLPVINIFNKSPAFTMTLPMVVAHQYDLDHNFAPNWGDMSAKLRLDPKMPQLTNWTVDILNDDGSAPGAAGYHTLLADGTIYAKIFADTCIKYSMDINSVISHEIKEMIADPFVDSIIEHELSATQGVLYAAESCDPVQDESYGVHGFLMSNFVFPCWFSGYASKGKFDFLGSLKAPLTRTSGGYYESRTVSYTSDWNGNGRRLYDKEGGELGSVISRSLDELG